MNNRLYYFSVILALLFSQSAHTASLASLKTRPELPTKLAPLDLLDGAIARETDLLKRLRKAQKTIPKSIVNKKTGQTVTVKKLLPLPRGISPQGQKIISGLFNHIPNTEHVELSKQLNHKTLVERLINNLVYSYLRDKLPLNSPIKTTQLSAYFQDIQAVPKATDSTEEDNPKEPPIQINKAVFAKAPFEEARLAILGALWYYQEHIKDFDYYTQLQKQLINACNELLEKTEELTKKKNSSNSIKILKDIKAAAEEITFEAATNEDDTNEEENTLSKAAYEQLVFKTLANLRVSKYLPPILEQVDHAEITLHNSMTDFADCVETLVRNLINVLAYDPINQATSVEKLRTKFPNAHKDLIAFYEKHQYFTLKTPPTKATPVTIKEIEEYNSHSHKNQTAYNDWAKLVSNVPNIDYCKKDYNMEPTWANLIIIIDHLLGQNWLEEWLIKTTKQKLSIENKDERITFAQQNLPQFIQLFGESSFEPENEYGTLKITTDDDATIRIKLNSGHGYVKFQSKEKIQQPNLTTSDYKAYPILWLLLPVGKWPKGAVLPYTFYIFAHPIDKGNSLRELVENISGHITYPLVHILEEQIKTYLSDQDSGRIKAIIALYTNIINNLNNTVLSKEQKNAIIKKAIQTASSGVKDSKTLSRRYSLEFFKTLVEKGHAFNEATQAAKKIALKKINDSDEDMRKYALSLFDSLVAKDQAFNEAAQAATTRINDSDGAVKRNALQLFNTLVKKGHAFNEATQAAKKMLNEDDWLIQVLALNLFQELVTKDQAFNEAAQAVTKGVNDSDWSIRETALQLLDTFVTKNQGFNEAAQAAAKEINNSRKKARERALKLFDTLFAKNQGFNEAAQAATRGIHDPDKDVRRVALALFNTLVTKDQGFNEAAQAATKGIHDPDEDVRKDALALSETLAKKGKAFNEATQTTSKMINDRARNFSEK